jgi:hypothetical protein
MSTPWIYIYLVIFAIIFTFLISHYINYKHINLDAGINIQQTEHPSPAVIYKMLATKLPCIFMYEVEMWDGYDLLIGYPHDAISTVLLDNKELVTTLKKEYLEPFNLPLSRDWKVNLVKQTLAWDALTGLPTRESSFNHLIANFTGLMMVCFINPKHAKLIAEYNNNKPDLPDNTKANPATFTKLLETEGDKQNIDYLTVPIRPGHVLYIPYGWYYYLYCGQADSYCTYMDLFNTTWF